MEQWITEYSEGILTLTQFQLNPATPQEEIWKDLMEKIRELEPKAVLTFSKDKFSIQPQQVIALINMASTCPSVIAAANVRVVLPSKDEMITLSLINSQSAKLGIDFQTFFDVQEAREWLKERISQEEI